VQEYFSDHGTALIHIHINHDLFRGRDFCVKGIRWEMFGGVGRMLYLCKKKTDKELKI
jgi:hypothetical protein